MDGRCEEYSVIEEIPFVKEIKSRAYNPNLINKWIYGVNEPLLALPVGVYCLSDFWKLIEQGSFEYAGDYIGLYDKNKVEMYDGDIVKSIHNFYYVFGEERGYTKENCDEGNWLIEWDGMGFRGKPISEKCLGSSLIFHRDYPNAEIIGNKWENPELLRKEEEANV